MSIILREYQVDIVNRARLEMQRGIKALMIVAPTGSGKTSITSDMIKKAHDRGRSSLFIVHRIELVKQSALAFEKAGVPFGIIAAGFPPDYNQPVQIAMVQTLYKRRSLLKHRPDLVVFDETHHVAAKNWAEIFHSFADSYRIGITATPQRLDGLGLGDFFSSIVEGPSVEWLIGQGYLSPYKIFAAAQVDLSGVHTRMGDYVPGELAHVMDQPKITGDAIKEYLKRAQGKRAVVFCVNIEHSQHVAQQFREAGIKAQHVDGKTPAEERDDVMSRFAKGEIDVVTNVNLFGEGYDCPALECLIILRPTKSLGWYLQMCGRVLRPSPGKEHAIILDHVRACVEHGLPDDVRTWSLSSQKRREKGPASVKICPSCFAALPAASSHCTECAYVFTSEKRDVALDATDDELVEINKEKMRVAARKDQGRAQSLGDLIALGKQRGYKNPYAWGKFVFQARQARKNKGLK